MSIQGYISKELTHFVGKGRTQEEQYSILVERILNYRWLRHSPNSPAEPVELLRSGGVSLSTDPNDPEIPPGELYRPQVVCFCDIPTGDLDIHMSKYSHFGLSFLKPFLIDKGANPVYYIAENSPALKMFVGKEDEHVPGGGLIGGPSAYPRKPMFEHNVTEYNRLFWDLLLGDSPLHNNGLLAQHPEEHQKLSTLHAFLNVYVVSFFKFFDDTTSDENPKNFYMEREWRVLGDVHFDLKDVYRVFLPSAYADRLREDLPDYAGKVTCIGA